MEKKNLSFPQNFDFCSAAVQSTGFPKRALAIVNIPLFKPQHGHMNQFMHKQKNSMLTNEFYPWRESKRTPFRHNNSETYSQTVWK